MPSSSPQAAALLFSRLILSYLEADLVRRLLGVPPDGVGSCNCGRVDGPVVCDDEASAAVVELEPVEHRPARDHRTRQRGEAEQVRRQQVADRVLKERDRRKTLEFCRDPKNKIDVNPSQFDI
jgi:hypothetical protein